MVRKPPTPMTVRNQQNRVVQFGLVSANTIYTYNEQKRLISTLSSNGAKTTYLYDNNGNLLNKHSGMIKLIQKGEGLPTELPSYDLIIKRDSTVGTGTKNLTSYQYDNYNRLIRTDSENTSATYRYNAQGYRTEKTVNGATTRYLYEGDKVVLETDKTNNQKAFQVYGTNLLYRSVVESDGMGAEEYYYLYNAHGE